MSRPRVAIVGGGLAGLAAAVALSERDCEVTLFESRRQLGGRAASFRDPTTSVLVDFCQHVSMGCCTNLTDFCRRTGIQASFTRERTLYFISPDGCETRLSGTSWLPAPLHLLPALMRLSFLSLNERRKLAVVLVRLGSNRKPCDMPMLDWLRQQGQSENTIERFWTTVLVSALGDTLDRVSVTSARKVFVDGFMSNRHGYEVLIPTEPLSRLFDEVVGDYLCSRGVSARREAAANVLSRNEDQLGVNVGTEQWSFERVIVAVPWRQLSDVLDPLLQECLQGTLEGVRQIQSSPITGVHLWLDRPVTPLPHAVLIDCLSQWLFNRGPQTLDDGRKAHYCQVVISSSRSLAGLERREIARRVLRELTEVFSNTEPANLLQSRVVTEQHAVFTPAVQSDLLRPQAQTRVPGLFLAGDWTATGWPSTMESAVRSGYLAAEAVCRSLGQPDRIVASGLGRGILARLIMGCSS